PLLEKGTRSASLDKDNLVSCGFVLCGLRSGSWRHSGRGRRDGYRAGRDPAQPHASGCKVLGAFREVDLVETADAKLWGKTSAAPGRNPYLLAQGANALNGGDEVLVARE